MYCLTLTPEMCEVLNRHFQAVSVEGMAAGNGIAGDLVTSMQEMGATKEILVSTALQLAVAVAAVLELQDGATSNSLVKTNNHSTVFTVLNGGKAKKRGDDSEG